MLGVDVRRVGRRDVRLGHRERGPDLTGEQRVEPLLLLLLGAEHGQDFHVARVRSRAVQRRRGQVRAAPGDLGQRRVLQVGQPRAVLAGKEKVPQAAGSGLCPELVQHRGTRPGPRVLEGRQLLDEDRFGRVDPLVHEHQKPLAEPFHRRVECEIHQICSFIEASPAATIGSTTAPTVSNPAPTVCPWV